MASGPWDNVQLAGPPNGPAWVNSAAQMMGATGNAVSGAFNAYQKGQEFQNQQQLFPYQLAQAQQQQQLSDLFKGGVPTLPNGSPDYASIVKSMIQTGGANTAGQMLPLLSQIQANQTAQTVAGGGQPNPTAPQAGSPSQIIPPKRQDNGAYWKANQVSSGLTDNTGGSSIDQLAAERHIDLHDFLAANPWAVKFTGNDNLSKGEQNRITGAMRKYIGSGDINTVQRSGTDEQDVGKSTANLAVSNELKPSSVQGGPPISPAPTSGSGNIRAATSPPGAIASDGLEDQRNRRTAQSVPKDQGRAPTAGGYEPPSGAEMKRIYDDAQANLNAAKTFGLQTPQGQAYRDAGNQGMELYKQMRKEREDYAKVTDPKMMEAEVRRKASEKEAEDDASMLKELTDAGITAKGHIGQLDVVGKLGEKVGYGVVPKVQSFLGQHGIETRGLSDIQAYERAIDYMAPQLRPIGSGRLMQQELTAFKASLGGLMTTPEGRKISVENLKLVAEYQRDVGQIASDKRLSVQDRIQKIINFPAPHLKTMDDIAGNRGGGGQAPMPGARQARDGKWYVSDPNRAGKYLEVRP